MYFKQFKVNSADGILLKETSVHFVNPYENKIDLGMLTKNMHEKDEHAYLELFSSMYDDRS